MSFSDFIQLAVEAELKLEQIRMQLANQEMFEPFTTFKRLDQPRVSGLKEAQILEFLDDNQIKVTEDELAYIFRVLDVDADGTITYEDFKNSVLPKQNDQARDQALNHKNYEMPIGMLLPKDVETLLTSFFQQLQQNFNQFLNIQEQINLNELDIYESDTQITVQSLKNWVQANEVEIPEEVLQNFVILIDGNQANLQNLLDQIYQPQQAEEQQQEQQEEPQVQQEDKQNEQNQVEVQDQNFQQDIQQSQDVQESFNPNKQQQSQPQKQQDEQIVQSNIIQQSQIPESPLLNYYNQQILEEEAKIKKLCEELQISNPDTYIIKRKDSELIQYYEKEIQREIENISRLQSDLPIGSTIQRSKASFTPFPRYLDSYEMMSQIKLENEIRKEEAKVELLSSSLRYPALLTSQPFGQLSSVQPIYTSYVYQGSSGIYEKKPFSPTKKY